MNKLKELMPWNNTSPVEVLRGGDYGLSLASMQQEMNRMFERFYRGMEVHLTDWDAKTISMPAVNVAETPESFKIDVELAGMDPKKVSVESAGGFLTISGERFNEKEERKDEKSVTYVREEIRYGSFARTLALPESADGDNAKATFKNGILTVTVPKKPEAVQKAKKIEIREAA